MQRHNDQQGLEHYLIMIHKLLQKYLFSQRGGGIVVPLHMQSLLGTLSKEYRGINRFSRLYMIKAGLGAMYGP
jgi:hypothetical protein